MPHFAHDLLASDPQALTRLRDALHDGRPSADGRPDLAERFGATAVSVPAPLRKPRRRRPAATARAGNLVAP